jgi:hypothetical protein
MKNLIVCLLWAILIFQPTGPGVVRAANKNKDEDRLRDSGAVLKEIVDVPDNIPQDLLDKGRLCSRLSLRLEGRIRGWW